MNIKAVTMIDKFRPQKNHGRGQRAITELRETNHGERSLGANTYGDSR